VAAGDAEDRAGEAAAGAAVDGARGAEEGKGRGQGREQGCHPDQLADQALARRSVGILWLPIFIYMPKKCAESV
jgi:hypothetical protein